VSRAVLRRPGGHHHPVGINLAGGGCSDLIIVRVIDPDFSAWQPYQHPESIANGPYREPVVVPGVTSTTSAQPGRHLLGDRAPPHR
jgi:hypothetical protein